MEKNHTLLDNGTVKPQLKFQMDTCDSLRVPSSPYLKYADSRKTRSKSSVSTQHRIGQCKFFSVFNQLNNTFRTLNCAIEKYAVF